MVADWSIGRRDQIPRGRSPGVVREWGRACGTEGCLRRARSFGKRHEPEAIRLGRLAACMADQIKENTQAATLKDAEKAPRADKRRRSDGSVGDEELGQAQGDGRDR